MEDILNHPIYVYDGECVLCSKAVRYVLKYEKEQSVRFVAIKSDLGRKIAEQNNVDPDAPHTFIYLENGDAYFLSDAVFALAKKTGGPWTLIRFFRFLPRPIRDWFYSRIANNRYNLFGKLEACYVPTPEMRDRFVLN